MFLSSDPYVFKLNMCQLHVIQLVKLNSASEFQIVHVVTITELHNSGLPVSHNWDRKQGIGRKIK